LWRSTMINCERTQALNDDEIVNKLVKKCLAVANAIMSVKTKAKCK